MSSCE
jgi:hypothetical protein